MVLPEYHKSITRYDHKTLIENFTQLPPIIVLTVLLYISSEDLIQFSIRGGTTHIKCYNKEFAYFNF